MNHQPLVSIIMPSYHTANFIGESIQSVLNQTYQNWELLIVDDCSKDETDAVVANYTDPRIIYLKNETNSGAAISRNRAIAAAKGQYIAFLDSDDLWRPEKLEKQVAFMQDNDYGFTYTEYEWIDEQSQPMDVKMTGPKRIGRNGFYLFCWVGCLTVMYDATKVGLIQIPDLKKRNDYAMWLKINRKLSCHLLQEDLAQYRKRRGSISNVGVKKLIKHHYRLFREIGPHNPVLSVVLAGGNILFGAIKKVIYTKRGK